MARKPSPEAPAGLLATIERADLLKALETARDVAKANPALPILGHLVLSAEAGGDLVIVASDQDREATVSAPAEVAGSGAATMSADSLYEIAKGFRADAKITLRHDPAKLATVVTSGRARFTAPGFEVDTFPRLEPPGGGYSHTVDLAGSILAQMIARTQFAISTEETRYYLGGIYVHVVEGAGGPRLRLVATDGHRLARYETRRASGLAPDMPGVILPRKTVTVLRAMAADAGDAPVTIEVARSVARFTAGSLSLVSKLIDGTYPDYQRVIPANNERPMTAPTAEFAGACERVRKMSLDKAHGVRLRLDPRKVSLSLRNNDGGEASDEVDVEFEGEPLEIGFNGKYLAEMIGLIGGDTITLKFGKDGDAPVLMMPRDSDGDEVLSVLMPLKLFQR